MIDLDALEQRLHSGPVTLTTEELLELVNRARGLSEVRPSGDEDEVCVACNWSTSGHTHEECYQNGRRDGGLDTNIGCAAKLADAFDIGHCGYFDDTLQSLLEKKSIEQLIEASSLGTPEAKAERAQAPKVAVDEVLRRVDLHTNELSALRNDAKVLARIVFDCNDHHSACRTERISWVTLQLAWRILESR